MASGSRRAHTTAGSGDVQKLVSGALAELRAAINAQKDKFFPAGIDLIDVSVTVNGVTVSLKVAGPKSASVVQ